MRLVDVKRTQIVCFTVLREEHADSVHPLSLFSTKCISMYLVIPTGPIKVYFPVSCSQAQHDVMCISLHLCIPEILFKVVFISLSVTAQARLKFPCIGIIKYKLENKGIVFKARWFVRPDKTQARPLFKWNDEGIARVISCTNNGHARVLSGLTNHLALTTIPFSHS